MAEYYDLDAILVEDERLPVIFRTGATSVGRALDPSCDDDDLHEGSKVELPFWMVPFLAARDMVEVKLPKFYNESLKRSLQASAGSVNLREKSPYFYSFSLRIEPIVMDADFAAFVATTFKNRYSTLISNAHSVTDASLKRHRKLMTMEELEIFEAGRKSMAAFRQWNRGDPTLLRSSILGRRSRRMMAHLT
eukprot:jgi/Mesvir1/22990/Mv05684-RA.1